MSILTSLNQLNPNVPEFLKPYTDRITAPVNIITLAYHPGGFIFSEDMAKLLRGNGRPTIVVDMEEYGWDRSWVNKSVMGVYADHTLMYGDAQEREKLAYFLKENPPLAYFKREFSYVVLTLLETFTPAFPVLPIELLSPNLPQPPDPNRGEFLARSTDVFHWYGISHPDRMEIHKALDRSGLRTDALEVHHTERRPIMNVMTAQGMCKASMNLGGSGEKCFRNAEACWNSVPIMADLGMEYRVKWGDDRAIMLPTKEGRILIPESLEKIQACLDDQEGMWERMKLAHENAKRMEINNYMAEINKEIQDRL